MAARVTLFKNGFANKDKGVLVAVPDSIERLIEIAKIKLNLPTASEVFTSQGAIVEDVSLLRDNDVLYIGQGEIFMFDGSTGGSETSDEKRRGTKRPVGALAESNFPMAEETENAVKLFVGSLPKTVVEDEIQSLFGQYGTLCEIKLMRDKVTGQSKGAAFVKYLSKEDADRAIANLSNYVFEQSPWKKGMVVRYADGELERVSVEYKLFVGSIPFDFTEDDLMNLFSKYGHPFEIFIIKGVSSTTHKRAAFVKFRSRSEAMNAINHLHGYKVSGDASPLVVRFADKQGLSSGFEPLHSPSQHSFQIQHQHQHHQQSQHAFQTIHPTLAGIAGMSLAQPTSVPGSPYAYSHGYPPFLQYYNTPAQGQVVSMSVPSSPIKPSSSYFPPPQNPLYH